MKLSKPKRNLKEDHSWKKEWHRVNSHFYIFFNPNTDFSQLQVGQLKLGRNLIILPAYITRGQHPGSQSCRKGESDPKENKRGGGVLYVACRFWPNLWLSPAQHMGETDMKMPSGDLKGLSRQLCPCLQSCRQNVPECLYHIIQNVLDTTRHD